MVRGKALEGRDALRIATDEQDLDRLRALDAMSCVIVPLRARGRRLGSLTLIATRSSGRRYDDEDLEFAILVVGRVGIECVFRCISRWAPYQ